MFFSIRKTGYGDALQIVSWEYSAPYEIYNLRNSPLVVVRLVDGRYYSVFTELGLTGFFCYGPAGRLRMKHAAALYQNAKYLDVGLGMHPKFCGRGLGTYFVRAGLVYAYRAFGTNHFRLTAATGNIRAIKVYAKLGFIESGIIKGCVGPVSEFTVMTLDDFVPPSAAEQARLNRDLPRLFQVND